MWRDIFLNNKEAVLETLGRFNEDLSALQRMIPARHRPATRLNCYRNWGQLGAERAGSRKIVITE
jgi:prephenate dehydrogenase